MKTLWFAAFAVLALSFAPCCPVRAAGIDLTVETHFTTNLPAATYHTSPGFSASVHAQTLSNLHVENTSGSSQYIEIYLASTIGGSQHNDALNNKNATVLNGGYTDLYLFNNKTDSMTFSGPTYTDTCEADGHLTTPFTVDVGPIYGDSVTFTVEW